MDRKKLVLLIGALVLAAATAFMARSLFAGAAAPQTQAAVAQPVADGPKVLVATRALPIGTILQADSFRYQPWPKDLVQDAYFIEGQADPASLAGTVVRFAVTAGQPITQGALVKPGDRGFLAAALGPGMRAITVSVSTQTGVGGFVFPGDRVDLMLTQDVAGGGDGPPLKVSETIIRNLRVLATDQRTDNMVNEEGKTEVRTFNTVTLEVTPKIAEKISVAQTIGTLSFSLRSIADNTAELERAIAAGEVSVPEGDDPKAEKEMLLAVASRPVDSNTTYVTGADVSRFQRSSVPARTSSAPANGAPAQGGGTTIFRSPGPVVRISRGNNVTEVTVGGN